MTTKVILHGGYAGHENSENDAFFKEILSDTPNSPNVLMVFFAKESDRVQKNREKTISQFEKNKGEKIINYDTATEKSFLKQIQWANIVYFHGGKTLKLLENLKKFNNLKDIFVGKTVAGESAGAYVLSKHFYNEKTGGMFEGIGLVPVNTICHYTGKPEEFGKTLPNDPDTLLLPDYIYKVFCY